MGDGTGWGYGVLDTGYNMEWETIIYINIYFVDITENCKEKRLKIRDIISKWINVKKNRIIITLRTINTLKGISIKGNFVLTYGDINRIFKLGLKIMIKLGNKGCIRYPGGTGILGMNG